MQHEPERMQDIQLATLVLLSSMGFNGNPDCLSSNPFDACFLGEFLFSSSVV